MAFQIKKRDTYPWTVEHVIGMTRGKPEVMSFDAEFKALPQSRIEELIALSKAGEFNNERFLDEVLAGWHELTGENGAEFGYDKTNLDKLMDLYPGILGSIGRAYMESIGGAAARKN